MAVDDTGQGFMSAGLSGCRSRKNRFGSDIPHPTLGIAIYPA